METEEISKYKNPMDFLKIFFRRKWFVIAPAFAGLVLGIAACFIIPPAFESYTLILIEEEKIINPLIQGLAVSTTAGQRMQSIREQLLGWNSLVELSRRLSLDKKVQTQSAYEDLILGLRKNIGVQMKTPNIIRISYIGKNPEETQLVAQTMTTILVDENMRSQTKETDVAIGFIKEQLEVYKRKIKESEVADLEEQLKSLLIDSTEQHPLVKELRGKIAIAKKELESGNYKVAISKTVKDSAEYKALQIELDKIINDQAVAEKNSIITANNTTNASSEVNSKIYKMMLIDKLDTSLARDKNVNEGIYQMLLQKLEQAKITQRLETSKEGTRYTVIDPPRLPLRPAKPNKVKVMIIGLFLGLASGVGLVFGREFMDQSFIDLEDAKATLTLPVLGGISRITTQEELDKEKHRARNFILIGVALSVALIISSFLIFLFRR